MMNNPIPCVLLINPKSADDPSLTETCNGFVLKEVLSGLQNSGLIADVLISVSESVPGNYQKTLASCIGPVHISPHEQPQRRLVECMEAHSWHQALILTSYSVLLDFEALIRAIQMVNQGKYDAVYPADVIAAKFFMVINLHAAKNLTAEHRNPLPPFVFPSKLRAHGQIRLATINGLELPWEKFLWELLFAGNRNAIPPKMLESLQACFPGEGRFQHVNFQKFIAAHYGLKDSTKLDAALEKMTVYDSSLRLAMQINHARDLCAHLPMRRETALEIGHGKTPLTSIYLAAIFDQVAGADVYNHNQDGIDDSHDFISTITKMKLTKLPGIFNKLSPSNALNRTKFYHCEAQKLHLPPNSVDFCFSRMVLEHVTDIQELTDFLATVMRPGGVMIHEIGLQDHQDLSHINFEFLCHSKEEWAAMQKGTNLLRVSDFVALWEKSGFEVQVLDRDVRIVPPPKIHPSWQEYRPEDLYCYCATIKAIRINDDTMKQ